MIRTLTISFLLVAFSLPGRAIAEQSRYRMGFGGGAWLEVEGGFDEREVRVLASIVREAARC